MTGLTRTGGVLTAVALPHPLPVTAEIEGVMPRALPGAV
ncbi:hypothetical protein P3T39_004555 [Kitasatospora sp. GP82]|nr:hypothetical protein [Kitasatospora sp. GP82]